MRPSCGNRLCPSPFGQVRQELSVNMQQMEKFGIYLNAGENLVVRVNSPYWLPEEPDWVMLTNEVNATLLEIRALAQERGLVSDGDAIVWGRIPVRD